jgi:hypothetical protein
MPEGMGLGRHRNRFYILRRGERQGKYAAVSLSSNAATAMHAAVKPTKGTSTVLQAISALRSDRPRCVGPKHAAVFDLRAGGHSIYACKAAHAKVARLWLRRQFLLPCPND